MEDFVLIESHIYNLKEEESEQISIESLIVDEMIKDNNIPKTSRTNLKKFRNIAKNNQYKDN